MSTQDLKLFDLLDGLEMTKSQYEWLARRFENMTAKEALLFRGAMQIEQPQATCDVMQIANQLEHYELLYGAGNDFALGTAERQIPTAFILARTSTAPTFWWISISGTTTKLPPAS